jgi:nitroreductase
MTASHDPERDTARLDRATVEAALAVAVRAPSIHNTQPWRWRLQDGDLFLLADRSRQLDVADPDGHSMLLSCGAALHLTELALRAQGVSCETTLLPNGDGDDVLARLRPLGHTEPGEQVREVVEAALRRRSDRRPFAHDPVPDELIEALQHAGTDRGAHVHFPVDADQRVDLAVAVSWADRVERDDEAYIAEMQRWLRDPEVHALVDGVPLDAVPHVPADQPRRTDVPLRDFEVGVTGQQLIERDVDERPLIAVILTDFDGPRDHVWAGHAMMRTMLEAEVRGLASCPLSQAVDFAAFRFRVQGLMNWVGFPQMMLRFGYPSAPATGLPRTPRREPSAVLDVIR